MPYQLIKGDRVPIRLWAQLSDVDTAALKQLKRIAGLPWVAHHVAVMPDVHLGKGATVGSVVALRGAVAPAAVGVDIGCGMAALQTNLSARDLPDDLKPLRLEIEAAVPVGREQHHREAWDTLTPDLGARARTLLGRFGELDLGTQSLQRRASQQLGTLGGGNHFIELCRDQSGSGSCSTPAAGTSVRRSPSTTCSALGSSFTIVTYRTPTWACFWPAPPNSTPTAETSSGRKNTRPSTAPS